MQTNCSLNNESRGKKLMFSRLLIDESPLMILPGLARIVGLNEAIVLQRIHYWVNPDVNCNYFEGRYWIPGTLLVREFNYWGFKDVRRIMEILEDKGLLIGSAKPVRFKTKYYTIDYESLNQLMVHKGEGLMQNLTEEASHAD
jgi:hypothetical protein